jgi:nitroreductase
MLLAARALGLGATLTTLYLQFEKEAEAALGLPPNVHSYALLPIGYPIGRFSLTATDSDAKPGVCGSDQRLSESRRIHTPRTGLS